MPRVASDYHNARGGLFRCKVRSTAILQSCPGLVRIMGTKRREAAETSRTAFPYFSVSWSRALVLLADEKRIFFLFLADGCTRAVPWNDNSVIGQGQDAVVQRSHDLLK
jgi:hypothetical protein